MPRLRRRRSSTAPMPPTSKPCRPATPATRPRSMRNGATSSKASPTQPNGAEPWARPGSGRTGRSSPMASWSPRSTATGRRSRPDLGKKIKAGVASRGAEISDEAGPAGGARFGPRHHDDPRLPHARPFPRPSRSARPRAAEDRIRARPGLLRLHRGRLRPEDLHRPRARARIRDHPGDARHPPADLLRHARHRVHAHLRPGREELDPGAHRGPGQGHRLHAARARRRSSTSSSRPRASRSSSTSSTPAPSASASTAASR